MNEILVRISVFLIILLSMILIEFIIPFRKRKVQRSLRWKNNILILLMDSIILRLLFPAAAVGIAIYAENIGFGLFHHITVSFIPLLIISIILLDLTIYAQHVFFHYNQILWKVHRMHHTDLDVDVTTGFRFHPMEIVLSMVIKSVVIFLLGTPVIAVILFEIILNGLAMFNHSNIKFNRTFDKYLRLIIVTPDMHRIHHSTIIRETNSNFCFNLPWWDRIFKTYIDQPKKGHNNMTIGLKKFETKELCSHLWNMLKTPFIKI